MRVVGRWTLLAGVALTLVTQTPARGSGSTVGSYDEIGRLLTNATAPPPDSFERDAAAISALPPMPRPPGGGAASSTLTMLSAIPVVGIFAGMASQMATMAYVKSMQAYSARAAEIGQEYVRAGSLQHFTFYRNWTRVDMARMQSAIIQKPDAGETIYLDLSRHVYRVARTTASTSGDTYVVTDTDQTSPPTLAAGATTVPIATRVLSDVATHGYHTKASFTTASTLGRCNSGAHDLDEVEYDSALPDPQSTTGPPMTPAQIVNDACEPTTTSAHDEPGNLYVFRATTLTNTANGNITIVSERAHIKERSPQDESPFDIPPGFTEEKLP